MAAQWAGRQSEGLFAPLYSWVYIASRSHAFSGEEKAWGIAYMYVTCSQGMFDCVTYNRTDITLRNARPHMNNTEPLDLPSELLRD